MKNPVGKWSDAGVMPVFVFHGGKAKSLEAFHRLHSESLEPFRLVGEVRGHQPIEVRTICFHRRCVRARLLRERNAHAITSSTSFSLAPLSQSYPFSSS